MKDRKAFKFYRSYYDIALELPEKERLSYLMAIIETQFTGETPELKGLARFAFVSQKHSIDAQLNGYKALLLKTEKGAGAGKSLGGKAQLKEEEKEKEEEKLKKKKEKELLFDKFWEMYGKKDGKKYCVSKFIKLSDEQIETIFKTLPNYIKSTPDVKFRKNPLTYLNGEHWNDEIILNQERPRLGGTNKHGLAL